MKRIHEREQLINLINPGQLSLITGFRNELSPTIEDDRHSVDLLSMSRPRLTVATMTTTYRACQRLRYTR